VSAWRSLTVALTANTAGFVGPMGKAGAAAKGFGVAIAVALGASLGEAIKFESAMAGVAKTIDATAAEMAVLEQGIIDMANRMPASREEIAGVAEAAGQLGISKGALLEFTETAVMLGTATNLSAEDAATGLAKIANVMGTAEADFDRLGATLVELGNNGASTESDILAMSERLSGIGAITGATEADVLSLANAMSSVGIEAQLGGGAAQRIFIMIEEAVANGGEGLAAYAEAAGMSAERFASAWETGPVEAFDSLVGSLANTQAEGGNVIGILEELGIKGTQNRSVMLRLLGASDLLSESLNDGRRAWDENTALVEEAEKRYETAAARLQMFKNQVTNAGREIGERMLPALIDGVTALGQFGQGLANIAEGQGDKFAYIGRQIAGAWEHTTVILGRVVEGIKPLATLLGAIVGGTIVVGIMGLATALESTAGFIAENEWAAYGLAAALGMLNATRIASLFAGVGEMARGAAGSVRYLGEMIRQVAATRGVSNMAAAWGMVAASINPVTVAVVAAAAAIGGLTWWTRKQTEAATDLVGSGLVHSMRDLAEGHGIAGALAETHGRNLEGIASGLAEIREHSQATKTGGFTGTGMWGWMDTWFGDGEKSQAAQDEIAELGASLEELWSSDPTGAALAWERWSRVLDDADMNLLAEEMGLTGTAVKAFSEDFERNFEVLREDTGLTRGAFATLVRDLDLGPAELSTARGRFLIQDHLRSLAEAAGYTGDQIAEAMVTDPELLEEEAEKLTKFQEDVAGAFAGSMDVVAAFSGRQTVAEVQAGLAEIRAAHTEEIGGLATDAEDYGARVMEIRGKEAEALRAYREEHSVTADALGTWYADQTEKIASFSSNITKAFQMGYDPQLVSRLLQQGPEEAAGMVEAMVNDTSGRLLDITTMGEETMRNFNERVLEMARLTFKATEQSTAEQASWLGEAMAIQEAIGRQGAAATVQSIADELKLGPGQVAEIMSHYGIEVDNSGQFMAAIGRLRSGETADAVAEELEMGVPDVIWAAAQLGIPIKEETDLMQAVATLGTRATADNVAEELKVGVDEVIWRAAAYGVSLAGAVNPILSATGKPEIEFNAGGIRYRNRGGPIDGPNVDRDVIPAMLTPGEYVLRKDAVKQIGVSTLDMMNRTGTLPGFNTGGEVLVAAGRRLEQAGARISEHPVWDRVDPVHTKNSYHYRNSSGTGADAFDANKGAGTSGGEMAFFDKWAPIIAGMGLRVLWRVKDHFNHMHVDLGKAGYGMGGAGAHYAVDLPKPPSIGSHALAQGGEGMMALAYMAAQDYANTSYAASLGGTGIGPGGSPSAARAIVQRMAAQRGWTGGEWDALDRLVQGESGWNPNAANPTSSARGLFQKMTSLHGPVEPTVEGQAKWGFDYIDDAYGSPSNAYRKWLSRSPHWYNAGGYIHPEPWDTPGAFHDAPPGLNAFWNGTGQMERFQAQPVGHHLTPADRAFQPIQATIVVHNYLGNEHFDSRIIHHAEAVVGAAYEAETRMTRSGARHGT
jgi:TP901 family phage tail tape measure protein